MVSLVDAGSMLDDQNITVTSLDLVCMAATRGSNLRNVFCANFASKS